MRDSESGYYPDPGELSQDEMYSREPLEDAEPLDRADCSECEGEGETINHNLLTGVERVERCESCLGTGTQRTRDELADAFDPTEDELTIYNGPQ